MSKLPDNQPSVSNKQLLKSFKKSTGSDPIVLFKETEQAINDEDTDKAIGLVKSFPELADMRSLIGNTLLMTTISKKLPELSSYLVPLMSDEALNTPNNNKNTALILAIFNDDKDLTKTLAEKMDESGVSVISNNDNTALILASNRKWADICEIIAPKTSDEAINSINTSKRTALGAALELDMVSVHTLLIPKTNNNIINKILENNVNMTTEAKSMLNMSILARHLAIDEEVKEKHIKTINDNSDNEALMKIFAATWAQLKKSELNISLDKYSEKLPTNLLEMINTGKGKVSGVGELNIDVQNEKVEQTSINSIEASIEEKLSEDVQSDLAGANTTVIDTTS